jgi:hypothetical protein
MKKCLLCLFLVVASSLTALEEPLLSTVEDEIARIDHLIAATEEKVVQQRALRELMLRLQVQEEQFFKGDQSKAHAKKMVDSASQVLELIKASHLEHLFSSTYLEELALFSSIAGKTSPARP